MNDVRQILAVLDRCNERFQFPMLDNGYVYLAATRLSLYRSDADWSITVDVFGYSPRSEFPDTHVYTFGSRLVGRAQASDFVNRAAWQKHREQNPNNDSEIVFPVEEGDWLDVDNPELVSPQATSVILRGKQVAIPGVAGFGAAGIELENPGRIEVYELCRYLAAGERELVLATEGERRRFVPEGHVLLMRLEEWHHPDVVDESCTPGRSETFQQLAKVLVTGELDHYRPSEAPNTHWSHWPDGGTL